MITRNQILDKLREVKPQLRNEFHVKEIALFGSYTDENNTENRDIVINYLPNNKRQIEEILNQLSN